MDHVITLPMWKNKNYVRLLSAQVISLIGSGISSVCLALFAYQLAGKNASMVLSIAFALKMLAYIGLAPLFGAMASRLPKQKVMFFLDIIRALLFVCLPFVTQVWQVYVLMFFINVCSAGFTPLFQSSLPQVLPDKEQYTKALSFSRQAYDLEMIFSPLLTALLLGLVSIKFLFWIDSLSFLLSGVLILLCVIPRLKVTPSLDKKLSWNNITYGIQGYLKTPSLRSLWFAYLAAASASAMVIVNTVVYVREVLSGSDPQTALAMGLVGLGSIFIAFNAPEWLKKHAASQLNFIGLVVICSAFFLGAWTPSWLGFSLICIALGLGMSCIQTPAGLAITQASSNEDRSAFFAAHFSLTHFWWLITYIIAGVSAQYLGLAQAYFIMGLISLVSLGLYLWERSNQKKSEISAAK